MLRRSLARIRPGWPALVLAAAAPVAGCQYEAATQACYDLLDAYGARLAECGYYPSAEAGAQDLHDQLEADGLDCDTSPTGIRDEDELYMECLPTLETLACDTPDATPPSCRDQIVYRGG
ncbi:MAG TPA: hypothetical protein RMH99_10255 [Sandaracinaceae bacterium LLY-WYZ-13_1]|nr:hypothetical protein [Sandaracinaceae bacterium LLY-WYZ-13_1]